MTALPPMTAHTAAKHLLLKRYIDAWFPILGRDHKRLNYIDGFAGPGEYAGGEDGSPILAIKSALQHIENGTLASDVTVNFAFIERKPDYARHLERRLASMRIPASIKTQTRNEPFHEFLRRLLAETQEAQGQLAPTFAFVDPFGFSGIPFDIVGQTLSYPRCEIFVNIMVDSINRFLHHPSEKIVSHFPQTFGSDAVLQIRRRQGDRKEALLELYRSQLKTKAKYVGRFDMRNKRHRSIYSLFFATNSDKGFLKMKEAMWSVDTAGGALFSDADPHGYYTFDLFGTDPLRRQMIARFHGTLVCMKELERFVICETDYLPKHAREQLRDLEKQKAIRVLSVPGHKRRVGTYPPGKVSIQFL